MANKAYLQLLIAGGNNSPHVAQAHDARRQRSGALKGNLAPATGRAVKAYDAARQGRLTEDWEASNRLSADAELQGKLPIVRARSRDLERNESLQENYLNLCENNIVGERGFPLEMKAVKSREIDPATGEEVVTLDAEVNREIERGWRRFCQRENFTTARNMDAVTAFKLSARTVFRCGDHLFRKVRGYPNRFGFAVQMLEADYLDDQYIDFRGVPCNCPREQSYPDGRPFPYCESGTHEIRMGVELHGDWKFPVAYWLLAKHPGDYFFGNQFSVRRTRVMVDEIIHPFVFKRIEQTRGIPALVAAMLRLQMLGGYDEATLVKARAAAQKMGVLEKEVPDDIAQDFDWNEGDGYTMDGAPGQVETLPLGYKFKAWDPQDPSPQYDSFTKRQTRMVAAAGGVSYTSLSNDIENVNYSSIRSGLLEEREGWKGKQHFFITEVVRPIFEAWLPMAILSGEVKVSMARLDEFLDQDVAVFTGRRWPWVDPEKDVAAAKAAMDAGFKTATEIIAETTGGDFEKVTAGLGREKRMRAAEGLLPPEETGGAGGDGDGKAPTDRPGGGGDPAALDADPNTPSLFQALDGKVGYLSAMLEVVKTATPEKAIAVLRAVFGFSQEEAAYIVDLLSEPAQAEAIVALANGAQKPETAQVAAAAPPKPPVKSASIEDEPRDEGGQWTGGGGHLNVGKEGDWSSLGLPSAETLDAIALPARMGRKAAMEKLSSPYVKEDPLGNAVGFGSRLKGHLEEHIREGDHARPGFLPHMEATVENPAEIWQENTPKGPRLRHIAAFTSKSGRRSFTVVSHQLGETRATVVTGVPQRHAALNKARKGKLLYVRPKVVE